MSFQHLNTPPPGPESCRLCVLLRRGSWLVSFRGREDPGAGKCVRLVLWYTGLGCRATWVVRLDISWRRQAHCRVLEEPRAEGGHRKTEKCRVSTGAAQVLICIQLFETPWTVAPQAPLSMGFSRQEYWSGLPFPPPGDLPDPGTELTSPALKADSLLLSHLCAPISSYILFLYPPPKFFTLHPESIFKTQFSSEPLGSLT